MLRKPFLLILATLLFLIGCNTINETRKSAGISRQQLFVYNYSKIAGTNNKWWKKNHVDSLRVFEPTLFWSHYDVSQRAGLYFVAPDSGGNFDIRVISENPPDAAFNNTIDALINVKVKGVDVGAKFSAMKSLAELGQRNSANYMIRDVAFRIESLLNNHPKGIDENIVALYKELLNSAENIAIAEAKGETSKNKAETLQELSRLIAISQDPKYKDLKLDSTFFQTIQKYLDN